MQSDLQQQAQAAYDEGVSLRRQARFGEAMNAFARAAELAEEAIAALPGGDSGASDSASAGGAAALSALRDSALASIELIREINGFVNTDLMNP